MISQSRFSLPLADTIIERGGVRRYEKTANKEVCKGNLPGVYLPSSSCYSRCTTLGQEHVAFPMFRCCSLEWVMLPYVWGACKATRLLPHLDYVPQTYYSWVFYSLCNTIKNTELTLDYSTPLMYGEGVPLTLWNQKLIALSMPLLWLAVCSSCISCYLLALFSW